MRNAKNIISGVLVLLVIFILGLLTRPFLAPICNSTPKVDTLYVRDTIMQIKPVETAVIKYKDRPIYIPVTDVDTLRIKDTLYLTLPTQQKVYSTDRYKAWISGYKPVLDSIAIYTQDKIITKTLSPKKNTIYASAALGFNTKVYLPLEVGYSYSYKYMQFDAGVFYIPFHKQVGGLVRIRFNLIQW